MAFSPSTSIRDADYLLERATAEADAAEAAAHARSAEAHRRLASLYLDRVFGPAPANRPRFSRPVPPSADHKDAFASAFRRLRPVASDRDFTELLIRLP